MTRAKARKLNPIGFEQNGVVKVQRRIAYDTAMDKALLLKRSSNVVRRRTIGLQKTPARPILKPARKSMAPRVMFALPPLTPSPSKSSASTTPTTSIMTRYTYGSATATSPLPSPSTPTTKIMIQPSSKQS